MADKDDGDYPKDDCESRHHISSQTLKGPEKELQSIFKTLRVDNRP